MTLLIGKAILVICGLICLALGVALGLLAEILGGLARLKNTAQW